MLQLIAFTCGGACLPVFSADLVSLAGGFPRISVCLPGGARFDAAQFAVEFTIFPILAMADGFIGSAREVAFTVLIVENRRFSCADVVLIAARSDFFPLLFTIIFSVIARADFVPLAIGSNFVALPAVG